MDTLESSQERIGAGLILVGHDMGLMAQFVDRIAVAPAAEEEGIPVIGGVSSIGGVSLVSLLTTNPPTDSYSFC